MQVRLSCVNQKREINFSLLTLFFVLFCKLAIAVENSMILKSFAKFFFLHSLLDIKVREIMVEANMKVLRARAEIRAEYEAKIKDIKSKQWVR